MQHLEHAHNVNLLPSFILLTLRDVTIRILSLLFSSLTMNILIGDNVLAETWTNEMDGVLGHDSALLRLYWVGDNLG